MNENIGTWPKSIWLQHSDDGEPLPVYKINTDEVTWCESRIHDSDVEYVRVDLAEAAQKEAAQYRFLRDTNDADWRPFGIRIGCRPELADAEVDAAIAAQAQEQGASHD